MIRRRPLVAALGIALAAATLSAAPATAGSGRPGDLDRSFADDGVAKLDLDGHSELFEGVTLDGNRPAACGYSDGDVLVARFGPGGALDRTFGGNGWVTLDLSGGTDQAFACAFLPDGRIAAAGTVTMPRGTNRFAVFVFKRNGRPDPGFSDDGVAPVAFPDGFPSWAYHLVVQANGRIVAVGETFHSGSPSLGDFVAARLRRDGRLDDTFSGDGRIHISFGADNDGAWRVRLQRDGTLVLAGWTKDRRHDEWNTAVARLRPSGALDDSFAGDGKAIYDLVDRGDDWAYGLGVRRAGEIVVGVVNDAARKPMVLQVTATGKRDRVFGGGDGVATNLATGFYLEDLVLQDDGNIVLVGEDDRAGSPGAIRLTRRGARDETFGDNGRAVIPRPASVSVGAAAIDTRGRVLIAGSSSVAELMRILA